MLLPSRNQFCLVQKMFLVRFEILSQNWHLTSMCFLGERKLLPLFCDFTGQIMNHLLRTAFNSISFDYIKILSAKVDLGGHEKKNQPMRRNTL